MKNNHEEYRKPLLDVGHRNKKTRQTRKDKIVTAEETQRKRRNDLCLCIKAKKPEAGNSRY